jgi:hypothetical protein
MFFEKNPCKLSDDSMLDDDVPNSAVDLINKDRVRITKNKVFLETI